MEAELVIESEQPQDTELLALEYAATAVNLAQSNVHPRLKSLLEDFLMIEVKNLIDECNQALKDSEK
jgi:hypothetical protein